MLRLEFIDERAERGQEPEVIEQRGTETTRQVADAVHAGIDQLHRPLDAVAQWRFDALGDTA